MRGLEAGNMTGIIKPCLKPFPMPPKAAAVAQSGRLARNFLADLLAWPWMCRPGHLPPALSEERLGLTASSLTFTDPDLLVPLLTVALALFTAFPDVQQVPGALQEYFLKSLIPDNIAKPVWPR